MSNEKELSPDDIAKIFLSLLKEIDKSGEMTWAEIQEFLALASKGKKRKKVEIRRYNKKEIKKIATQEIVFPKRCRDMEVSFLYKPSKGVYRIHKEKLTYWGYSSVDQIKYPFPYSVNQNYWREKERDDKAISIALKRMTKGGGIEEFI